MSRSRDDRRRNARGESASLPLIREDGLPHHAIYSPRTGRHVCLSDCPSCNANRP